MMASRYTPSAAKGIDNLIDISDSEEVSTEILSISGDEHAEREANNRRLTQAINYLQQQGGDDSAPTFMDRVRRINDTLLNQLSRQGQTFDPKLYRQVRVMVMDAARDYKDAAERDSPFLKSDDAMPQYHFPAAGNEVLYRDGSSSPSPTPGPAIVRTRNPRALAQRRRGSDDNVQRVRQFKYGEPSGEPENWHKDIPAILPFPETLMMAHWESLKIDYDISRPKGESVADTGVPLNHGQLQPYLNLPQYESGSRFKLPAVSKKDQELINKYGADHIKDNVDDFYKRDTSTEGIKYSPHVFLERFELGHQFGPKLITRIRESLARTPSKSRTPNVLSENTAPSKRSSPPLIEDFIYDTDNKPATRPEIDVATPVELTARPSAQKSRTPQSQPRPSPAFRRISKEVRHAIGADKSPKPAPSSFKPTSSSKSTPRRTAAHVAIPQHSRGRPHKNPLPSAHPPPAPDTPPLPSTLSKRKPSLGSQPYTAPTSSTKKALRATKKPKTAVQNSVDLVDTLEDDSSDPSYPVSPVKKPTRACGSKAAAAGKLAKKRKAAKGVVAVVGESVGRGTTRSGMAYTII